MTQPRAAERERMVVVVRLFAVLRERAGARSVELELWPGASVADALATDALRAVTAGVPCVMAVNRRYATEADVLSAGDELALIPPVSGGASGAPGPDARDERAHAAGDRVYVELSDRPLSRDALTARVRDPRAGAEVMFTGVTREVDQLEYEAYGEMATATMHEIGEAALARHGLCRVAVAHRVGPVPLSEPCVIVAVSAPHRGAAFAGGREIIDAVKATAPIWKVEVAGDERRRPAGTDPRRPSPGPGA